MARQYGVTHYKGTLDGVRHYRIKGRSGWFASMKGGPTRQMIMNDPQFVETRKNITEFSGVSRAARSFRINFRNLLDNDFRDVTFNNRATTVVHSLMTLDTSAKKGKRGVSYSRHGDKLVGFETNAAKNLGTLFNTGKYAIEFSNDGKKAKMRFDNLHTRMLKGPKHASHARISLMLSSVSDYRFKNRSEGYTPCNPTAEGISTVEWSDFIELKKKDTFCLEIAAAIDVESLENAGVYASIGIKFYKEVGDSFYELHGCSAMMVAAFYSPEIQRNRMRLGMMDITQESEESIKATKHDPFGRARFKKADFKVIT